jgi:protein translocase SecG subunit
MISSRSATPDAGSDRLIRQVRNEFNQMAIFKTLLVIVQVLSALGVIALVLLQHGKGADVGAAFGSGASGSLFGASGSANFLSRTTAVLASLFFVCTLGLTLLGNYATAHAGLRAGWCIGARGRCGLGSGRSCCTEIIRLCSG